jgi:hypothetical protein
MNNQYHYYIRLNARNQKLHYQHGDEVYKRIYDMISLSIVYVMIMVMSQSFYQVQHDIYILPKSIVSLLNQK